LSVGRVSIPYRQIEEAEASLRRSFPADGRATLIWHLLDGGLAAEALVHARHAEASAAARREAEALAARLRSGSDFEAVRSEWQAKHPELAEVATLQKPGPFYLGASVAARVAAMEPPEWAGPLRTERGWELIRLLERVDAPRSLANVRVDRILVPVGDPGALAAARADWARLPLSGNPELLDALPLEFRAGRVAATP
jgi:hypothetical protein